MNGVRNFAVNALILLVLFTAGLKLSPRSTASTSAPPISILVGSRGHLLPRVTMTGGPERFDEAIAIGDLILKTTEPASGLRLVTLAPGLQFDEFVSIDTAELKQPGERLMSLVEELPVGSVVVAAVCGLVRTSDRAADDFPLYLGAELTPFRANAASWALISYRLESGWRTLAEAYSEESAVHLSFTLSANPADYEDFQSDVYFVEGEGGEELALSRSFSEADSHTPDVALNPRAFVGGIRLHSIFMRPKPGSTSRIRWASANLPANARFEVAFSRTAATGENGSPARFSIWIDGVEQAGWEPEALSENSWLPWVVELGNTPKSDVTLELRTEVVENGKIATYLWGQPKITWANKE